jgi:hypothetical protein
MMGLVLGFVLVASAIGQPHGARMVLYRLTEEYSRQKPFPSNLPLFTEDWEIPAFPDRTRSEAWLLLEGGRTLRSVASTTTTLGDVVQWTVSGPDGVWLYYPSARLAVRLSGAAALTSPPRSSRLADSIQRYPVSVDLLESQRRAHRVWGYFADLDPTEILVETRADPATGQLWRESWWALGQGGQRTLFRERRLLREATLSVDQFAAEFWTLRLPPDVTIRDYGSPPS